jgi:hypothetical protein
MNVRKRKTRKGLPPANYGVDDNGNVYAQEWSALTPVVQGPSPCAQLSHDAEGADVLALGCGVVTGGLLLTGVGAPVAAIAGVWTTGTGLAAATLHGLHWALCPAGD